MTPECGNCYKISRNNAKLTQEQAAELLGISARTLSDYENDHTKVPDDIVAAMADVYKCPLIVWWHLRHNSVLGKYLPDIQMPQTNGDMALQLWLARKDLIPTVEAVMEILGGEICSVKSMHLESEMSKVQQVKSMLLSTIIYSRMLIKEQKRRQSCEVPN